MNKHTNQKNTSFRIPSQPKIQQIIEQALQEDIGPGDVTTDCIIPPALNFEGEFIAKSEGILAGLEVTRLCFQQRDKRILIDTSLHDGERVSRGKVFALISGPAQAILSAERVALNFLQRMSGIATMTHQFVRAVEGTSAIILDTRKTAPGLRMLDKWAVQLGGGRNHRVGLYDMVLIKDNHITVAGSITLAVNRVREAMQEDLLIEVEVKNLDELKETLSLQVDRILLDNMSIEEMHQAVKTVNHRIPLEASGNVRLDNVAAIAKTGVDFISVGAITHSVIALDISLLLRGTK
jgi:nicotinate-nucleotide pyrophosphorylase (carboxylating)